MEARGPIRMSQIETEQKTILAVVRRLSDSGEIVTARGNDTYV
jgi:flagellar motor switch protein FliG